LEPFEAVLAPLATAARQQGLVVFAGAGLSVANPSALPGWRDLNSAFLDALCMRLAVYTDHEVGGPRLHEWLVARRDEKDVLAPDFQAQLAEDECGADYFRIFQVLDIDAWNDGHAALAALAGAGLLRALITTNFDRLAERALRKARVRYRVFRDVAGFDELARIVDAPSTANPMVLVVKAHGSVNRPTSMVDTLRQRVQGRPVALERAIAALVARHAALVVGFSGADLADRPHYLGLANGARGGATFIVMNRAGTEPTPAMAELVAQAGPHAHIVDGELPGDLVRLANHLGAGERIEAPWDIEIEHPGMRAHTLASGMYTSWGDRIDGIGAANILATLVEAAGANTHGAELLIKTWRHIKDPQQRQDESFLRYLTLLGRQLVEHGLLGPNMTALGTAAEPTAKGATAFDLLAFAAADRGHADAWAEAARSLYYVGSARQALRMLAFVRERAKDAAPLIALDAHLVAGSVQRAAGEKDVALTSLEEARRIADALGDEPSRARVRAQLGRCLASLGRFDEGAARLDEGDAAAGRLRHVQLAIDLSAARGALELRRNRADEAMGHLVRACDAYGRTGRLTRHAETLVDLLNAARRTKADDWVGHATGELERLVPYVPVLALDFRLWYAAAYIDAEQFDQARQALEYLRAAATAMEHDRVLRTVDTLSALLPAQ
jgi:tetratricopeptide (TPR) repeat protein/NAD-dependent SIR2 family protein deacetylase